MSGLAVILPQPTKTPFNGFEKTLDERVGDYALIEKREALSLGASIVPRGRLRRHPALARQTEPRLRVVTAELG
jgi:hypothetical protein